MKKLTNFYIEESDKAEAEAKLARVCGTKTKGQFASLMRVMVKQFIATPDDKLNPLLIKAIDAEYVQCQTCNKRSRM